MRHCQIASLPLFVAGLAACLVACAKADTEEPQAEASTPADVTVVDAAAEEVGAAGSGGQGGEGGEAGGAGEAGSAGAGGVGGKAGHGGHGGSGGSSGGGGTGGEPDDGGIEGGVLCGAKICVDQWCRYENVPTDVSFFGCCAAPDVCGASTQATLIPCVKLTDIQQVLHATCKPK